MKKEVDARGLSCPLPLIQTKKALEELEEGTVIITVDNETALENVSKFVRSKDYRFIVTENQGSFDIKIEKGSGKEELQAAPASPTAAEQASPKDLVVMISKDYMGEGSEELGRILMKSYLYTLTEMEPLPKILIFVNSGIRLTCEGSDSLENLRKLEAGGVDILSCGTCLDYFHVKSNLAVGGVSNMYTIVERLNSAGNTLQL